LLKINESLRMEIVAHLHDWTMYWEASEMLPQYM
jgi:hypothetical protein